MDLFKAVKENVTARQAAALYGLKIAENGMACCPFHDDHTPSLKLDKRYYCFGCHATGDAIDFVSAYLQLSPLEAAKRLAADFNIPYNSDCGGKQDHSVSLAEYRRAQTERQEFLDWRRKTLLIWLDITACWKRKRNCSRRKRGMSRGQNPSYKAAGIRISLNCTLSCLKTRRRKINRRCSPGGRQR